MKKWYHQIRLLFSTFSPTWLISLMYILLCIRTNFFISARKKYRIITILYLPYQKHFRSSYYSRSYRLVSCLFFFSCVMWELLLSSLSWSCHPFSFTSLELCILGLLHSRIYCTYSVLSKILEGCGYVYHNCCSCITIRTNNRNRILVLSAILRTLTFL